MLNIVNIKPVKPQHANIVIVSMLALTVQVQPRIAASVSVDSSCLKKLLHTHLHSHTLSDVMLFLNVTYVLSLLFDCSYVCYCPACVIFPAKCFHCEALGNVCFESTTHHIHIYLHTSNNTNKTKTVLTVKPTPMKMQIIPTVI